MDDSIIKPYTNSVAARTNMLKVTEAPEQLISKLIAENSGMRRVAYSCKEIARQKNESTEDYFLRVDSEVKSAIRAKLGLKASDTVKYDRLVIKSQIVMFFFLAEFGCSSVRLLEDAKRYEFELDKIAQALLSLRLKLSYINDAASNYDIAPTLYNSELYVGPIEAKRLKDGGSWIEALRVSLYYSKQNELALSLHKKAFDCLLEDSFIAESDSSSVLFHQGSKTLRAKVTLDAVRFAKRPFMAYSLPEKYKDNPKYANKGYDNCTNYHLTVSLNKLMAILSVANVEFIPVQFKANYIIDKFIESNEGYKNELIIIDAFSSYESDGWKAEFREHLKQTFGAKFVIGVEDAPEPEQLQTAGISYLVVNEEQKKNGSSIIRSDLNVALNSFFKAVELHLKSKCKIDFDYYTSVKLHRFLNRLSSVTQGLNIASVTRTITPKDDNGNMLPSVTVLNELEKNRIKKIKTELWLKEQVFHRQVVEGICLANTELVIFFVRKTKDNQTYISMVDVTTSETGVKINNHVRYEATDKSRFNFNHGYLKSAFPLSNRSCFDAMYDRGFYIYDKSHKKLLTSYTSDRVPRVIGNAAFDNVERSKEPNGVNRKRSPEECVLPYYINPTMSKQLHHVFLEDCGQEGVRCFVSKAGQPDARIEKQNRIQNILVFNEDGSKAFPLKEELTTLFLQSFTFDILNNNEVSKKSILQKVAELYIEN
ncbi:MULTISPECIES: hypothetical protein [Methylobacter]